MRIQESIRKRKVRARWLGRLVSLLLRAGIERGWVTRQYSTLLERWNPARDHIYSGLLVRRKHVCLFGRTIRMTEYGPFDTQWKPAKYDAHWQTADYVG